MCLPKAANQDSINKLINSGLGTLSTVNPQIKNRPPILGRGPQSAGSAKCRLKLADMPPMAADLDESDPKSEKINFRPISRKVLFVKLPGRVSKHNFG
jgi:hypothetical protein